VPYKAATRPYEPKVGSERRAGFEPTVAPWVAGCMSENARLNRHAHGQRTTRRRRVTIPHATPSHVAAHAFIKSPTASPTR